MSASSSTGIAGQCWCWCFWYLWISSAKLMISWAWLWQGPKGWLKCDRTAILLCKFQWHCEQCISWIRGSAVAPSLCVVDHYQCHVSHTLTKMNYLTSPNSVDEQAEIVLPVSKTYFLFLFPNFGSSGHWKLWRCFSFLLHHRAILKLSRRHTDSCLVSAAKNMLEYQDMHNLLLMAAELHALCTWQGRIFIYLSAETQISSSKWMNWRWMTLGWFFIPCTFSPPRD
jgi:hypothetical protein